MSITTFSISPLTYTNSDIAQVFQIRAVYNTPLTPLLILAPQPNKSVMLLGMRYKATNNGDIRVLSDSNIIFEENYEIGDSYGRSVGQGFICCTNKGEGLYLDADINAEILFFAGYYNSFVIT